MKSYSDGGMNLDIQDYQMRREIQKTSGMKLLFDTLGIKLDKSVGPTFLSRHAETRDIVS